MPKLRTYTDETELGFINDELDAIYAAITASTPALDDVTDVTITTPADDEVLAFDTGSGDWINQTPAEAGLLTTAVADTTYLKLDTSNDPLTDTLQIAHATAAILQLNDTGGNQIDIASSAGRLYFKVDATTTWRYRISENALEIPLAASEPDALLTPAAVFYENTADEELWVQWKDSTPVTHHARVARAKRTVVSLGAGLATLSGTSAYGIIGANTDVSCIQYVSGSTGTAAWGFGRPLDWDYGKIQITVYWTNYTDNVTQNHYWPQRLIGCTVGDHLATTQTCATWISGAQTTAGLNNSSLIGSTTIAMSSANDLTGEDFFHYRVQRQGAHGSDSSPSQWQIIHIKAELIEVE